jgi:quinol monooxygenase YgiN
MLRRTLWIFAVVLFLGCCVAAQAQDGYLDTYTVQVKPDKRAQFDAAAKKIAAANRQNKGDSWVTFETVYGEGNTVLFVSTRQSYADIETAQGAFMGAMAKSYGQEGTQKLFQEFGSCLASSHSTVRRRRWDLSSNAPADAAGQAKLVGETRWIRMIRVYVRPGQGPRFEEQLKAIKVAVERNNPKSVSFVSQSAAGDRGTIYYISQLRSSMAGFDGGSSLQEMMGDDAYKNYMKVVTEIVTTTEVSILAVNPELSSPPAETAAAAPSFWNPKPAMAKPAAASKAPAKKQ